ncbi:MAG TPA: type I-E CRISPR-associated protein Cse2/CasB [Turneriella sp.]|nr:type I-E CRISPR-associated protein Cse2/CasB [Turneriella sp.]
MRLFEKDSPSASALLDWWKKLPEHSGDRAALRRAASVVEAVQVPYTHHLISTLKDEQAYGDKIAAICGILSHVRTDNPGQPFARQMASARSGSDQPVISNLRFRRILQYGDITRDILFYQNTVRIVKNLDSRVNIRDLAESLYYWGDFTIKRWAYEYYGTADNLGDA